MIDKDRALKLLDKYVSTPWLRLHMIESEAIMVSLLNILERMSRSGV